MQQYIYVGLYWHGVEGNLTPTLGWTKEGVAEKLLTYQGIEKDAPEYPALHKELVERGKVDAQGDIVTFEALDLPDDATHGLPPYTFRIVEAAMCAWEAIQDETYNENEATRTHLFDFWQDFGSSQCRDTCWQLAPAIDQVWQQLPTVEKDYQTPFDWKFVPRLLKDFTEYCAEYPYLKFNRPINQIVEAFCEVAHEAHN